MGVPVHDERVDRDVGAQVVAHVLQSASLKVDVVVGTLPKHHARRPNRNDPDVSGSGDLWGSIEIDAFCEIWCISLYNHYPL